jgi:acetylornithine deacetylase/succinyl-diaminopimelate desuccinylase-like protein
MLRPVSVGPEKDRELADEAVRVCQALIRIDTTNPPGNERPAAELLAEELGRAGLAPRLLERTPRRTNVLARLQGNGTRPPLLLTAHLDVVEADPSTWRRPPFSGDIAEGCLWGRGAVDMKNMAAMCVATMARLAREKTPLSRDIIFAGVADEEAGCDEGSAWLCREHTDLVKAEYALGEGGGFTLRLAGRTLYPVQVAEKGLLWLKARVRGEPGHGSMPREDSAVVKLSAAIARLGARALPMHPPAVIHEFFRQAFAKAPALVRALVPRLLDPRVAPALLRFLPDKSVSRALAALLSNTASPTVLRAGNKTNVIPGVAECEIDGRILPGQTADDLLRELREVMGPDVELETLRTTPPMETQPIASPLFDNIVRVMADHAPDAQVVPYLLPGFTDGQYFSRIGARWYGFAPVRLPEDLRFADLFHGNDERIPVDGLRWGTGVLFDLVQRFCRVEDSGS